MKALFKEYFSATGWTVAKVGALVLLFILLVAGATGFDRLVLGENPELTLKNGEVVENETDGVINFATSSSNVADANLAGPRETLFYAETGAVTAGSQWIIGDTSAVWVPAQDFQITKLTFGADPDSADTLFVSVYKKGSSGNAVLIAGPDTLVGTTYAKKTVTSFTSGTLDVSAGEGLAVLAKFVGTFDDPWLLLEGRYYDVQ